MLGATLLLALREIRRHLLRSFLTTLGIIIGVAAVITMVTLGRGVTASVQDQISSLGSDVFIIFPIDEDDSPPRPFDADDVIAVERQIAGVESVAGSVNAPATAFHNGQDWSTSVRGADNAFLAAQSIDVGEGRAFTESEMASGQNVCIIGTKVREAIFVEGASPVGEEMRLDNVPCSVIGVFEERGQSAGEGQDADNVVMMPLKTVQRRFTGNDDLQYFVVKYDPAYSPARPSRTRWSTSCASGACSSPDRPMISTSSTPRRSMMRSRPSPASSPRWWRRSPRSASSWAASGS